MALRVVTENIKRIIPSADVRKILSNSGYKYTDRDIATLIFNSEILNLQESKSLLTVLLLETTDDVLAAELKERMAIQDNYGKHVNYWWPDELSISNMRFEGRYIVILNPFDKGDVVRNLVNGDICKVMTSQSDWNNFKNSRIVLEGIADYSDASIKIVPLKECDKTDEDWFYHEHVNPIYLERYR